MAHDFAKQRQPKTSGKRNASKKAAANKNTVSGHWSWFFSGMFGGLLFAFIIYLGVIKPAGLQSLQAQIADPEFSTEPIPEDDPGLRLGFYDYLEDNEVTVDVIPVDIIPQNQPTTMTQTEKSQGNAANYILHVGTFQVRLNAENLKARIILLNMNASIVPAVVNGRSLHRVRVGPYNGRKKAEDAMKILASNNIDTNILLMK